MQSIFVWRYLAFICRVSLKKAPRLYLLIYHRITAIFQKNVGNQFDKVNSSAELASRAIVRDLLAYNVQIKYPRRSAYRTSTSH